jgi:DNA-binding NtrC family response regulator
VTTAVMVISPQNSLRTSVEQLIEQGHCIVCPGVDNLGGFRHALNAAETTPNVIVVDYWLSRSQTIDFIRGLKNQGFAVILMGTSFLGRDVATQEKVEFIEKPFAQNELLKAITRVNKRNTARLR